MRLTLTNNFHGTDCMITVDPNGPNALGKRRIARIQDALCGVAGCTCSDILGIRGPQNAVDQPPFDYFPVTDRHGEIVVMLYVDMDRWHQ